MKNKDLKLKMLATATAVVIGGSVVFLSPAQAVLAAEAPVAISTQAILPKMTMAQVYAGLDVGYGADYEAINQEAYGTAINHYISNKIGWNLADVSAVTLEGKLVKYKYLQPDILDSWGQIGKGINHTGGDVPVGTPAWYALRVWPEGTTMENGLPGDIDQSLLQQLITGNSSFTGYTDLIDEGNTIRMIYSIQTGDRVGYYCIVEDKATKNTTSFQYTERADLYDDLRALTVIYSCLPQ